ncbi:MAG: GNAT family N-acetyltransferase [Bacteroidales bacterium]|nr:GNAT family N-acetyltransferase [Bacteroidales bacterium]
MAGFGFHTVQEWPLRLPVFRKKAEAFLAENGLRLEPVESWYVIENEAGDIVAGGGLDKDIIKCIAVSEQARGEGLMAQLVSHLLAKAGENGYHNIKVYTKPANRSQFEDLGFHLLAQAPEIILLENGRGLQDYCNGLAQRRIPEKCGVVVINADPMTLGHKYLIEQAAARIDHLYVIVLGGDRSRFTADARLRLVEKVCRRMDNVSVLGGGDYCISPATFPSYFLKNLDSIAE